MMMEAIPDPPFDCGRRVIPKLIDEIACFDPGRTFISVPKSTNLENGYEDISYARFAKAVNRCSWWIEDRLGSESRFQTLAYQGPLDVRYLMVLVAASKTGHVAFLSSQRNSLEAHLKLLEQIQCRTMIVAKQAPAMTRTILEERPMVEIPMPDFGYFDNNNDVDVYPWRGTFDEVKDKAFVILHTSGSTGIPKPVYVTHGVFASNDAHQLIPSLGGKPTFGDLVRGKRYLLALPVFHSANLTFSMGFNVFFGATCVLPPPVPMTADVLDGVHTCGRVDGSLLPPSLLVDIYNNPPYLANMVQRLRFVSYAGGSLPKQIGDLIASRIRLITLFGSTETKLFPIEINEGSTDWEHVSISRFLGHEFRPSKKNLSELVIVRNADLSLFQGVFSAFPALQEYPTKDLWEPHPKNEGHWAFRARADDIISFNNSEKLNPVTMEVTISSNSLVKSAVIGGHGEFQASLLVEPYQPARDEKACKQFVDDIWPTVREANHDCPAHGRIMKDFIIVADPEKPLPRADKQAVQRSAAIELYATEFQTLYNTKKEEQQLESVNGDGGSLMADTINRSLEATGAHDERVEQQANDITDTDDATELDARLEAVLYRVLPDLLGQCLGPAMIQIFEKACLGSMRRDDSPYDSSQNHCCNSCAGSKPNSLRNSNPEKSEKVPHQVQRQGIKRGIYAAIEECTYLHNVTDEANLFECGLDSLQVTALVREINEFLLRRYGRWIGSVTKKVLYDNPSIEMLVAAIAER